MSAFKNRGQRGKPFGFPSTHGKPQAASRRGFREHKNFYPILTFSKGSLVVLDKLAGDQVDLFVNGLCVARGDVVVIDDNFGIRITEVLKRPELSELTRAD